jgi:peroxin-11B
VLKNWEFAAGRDKLMRLVQYWARFLSFYLYRTGYPKSTLAIWKNLQMSLTLGRKLFRIGKPFSHLKLAQQQYNNKTQDEVQRLCSVVRNLGYFGYLTLDMIVWFDRSKIYSPKSAASLQKWAYKFWLIGLVAGLGHSLRRYLIASYSLEEFKKETEIDTKSMVKTRKEQQAAIHQFIWDLLDTSIPLSALKIVDLDDGVVGICGMVTSVFGLKQLF